MDFLLGVKFIGQFLQNGQVNTFVGELLKPTQQVLRLYFSDIK